MMPRGIPNKTAGQDTKLAEHNGNSERTLTVPLPKLPQPIADRRLLYYGAIGGLAVVEIIDWPVALLFGVGYALLSRNRDTMTERRVSDRNGK